MAVKAWTSPPIGCNSDSELQTWLTDLFDNITGTGGLVQTADTGQFNHTTITVPTNVNASIKTLGYWIFRFDDALQSTTPIFLRLEITYSGTAPSVATFGFVLIAGTATNGAGTITGVASNSFYTSSNRESGSPITAVAGQCKIVYNEERGFFGIAYGRASHVGYSNGYYCNRCVVVFFISRKQDASGEAIDGGFSIIAPAQVYSYYNTAGIDFSNVSWLRTQTITTNKNPSNDSDLWTSFPFMYAPTSVGSEAQCMRHYHLPYQDKPTTNYNMVAVYFDTIGSNQEFELVSGGTEPSNFICLGREYALRPYDGRYWTLAILWE